MTWYCRISGREYGPWSSRQLKELASQCKLLPEHSVRKGHDGPWVAARRVQGLFTTAAEPAAAHATVQTTAAVSPPTTLPPSTSPPPLPPDTVASRVSPPPRNGRNRAGTVLGALKAHVATKPGSVGKVELILSGIGLGALGLLILSTLLPWISIFILNFSGVTFLQGKLILILTLVTTVGVGATMTVKVARDRYLGFAMMVAGGWSTLCVLWLLGVVVRIVSEAPVAGWGLYFGIIAAVAAVATFAVAYFRLGGIAHQRKLIMAAASYGPALLVGLLLAIFLSVPPAPEPDFDVPSMESFGAGNPWGESEAPEDLERAMRELSASSSAQGSPWAEQPTAGRNAQAPGFRGGATWGRR